MSHIERIDGPGWRSRIESGLADGYRFAAGWAARDGEEEAWRVLLVRGRDHVVISCRSIPGPVESIVELAPAADWDEREAHDLRGVEFDGHSPMRALASHPEDAREWMTPVTGDGVSQVAVGPIHAGVIESGHFRLHVVGERILAVDLRLFYKHRGLERAAEGIDCRDALAHAARACAACSVTNAVAYAQAVEGALGLVPDRPLRASRTALLELERLYNHLGDIGAICSGVGFAPGAMAFAALKDRAQQVNLRAAGHRFLFGSVRVGSGAFELDAGAAAAARTLLGELRVDAASAWRELGFASAVQARLGGVGVLSEGDAERLGTVGPAARACGIADDARSSSPHLAYEDFAPTAAPQPRGDIDTRLRLRAAELEVTFDLLDDLLGGPLEAGATSAGGGRSPVGIGRVESPRGATVCAVEPEGSRIGRLHLRTGSYANWPSMAHAASGELLPDFPLINKSFELCYACVDR